MDDGPPLVLIGVAVSALLFGAVWLWPKVEKEFAPELLEAHVAISLDGGKTATVGVVEAPSGTDFELFAVLQGRKRNGEMVYFTDASSLSLGDQPVPASAVERWKKKDLVRVLWFTVEASRPYLEIENQEELSGLGFEEVFQADWPRAWRVPGSLGLTDRKLDPAVRPAVAERPFGTSRFHVRLEIMETDTQQIPSARYVSIGAEAAYEADFPRVTLALDGPLQAASSLFRLQQVEPVVSTPALLKSILDLTRSKVAFSRVTLVQSIYEQQGVSPGELTWSEVDIAESPALAGEPSAGLSLGDLLRVGGRVVMAFSDQEPLGILDRSDLCFDFDRGFSVVPLGEVFAESGGVIEFGDLGGIAPVAH